MAIQMILLSIVLTIVLFCLFVYVKIIHPEKRLYDIFHKQGIRGEPFVPLFGQIFELRRNRAADTSIEYLSNLFNKYGNTVLFSFGPLVRIMSIDPDVIGDMLHRTNASYYIKPEMFTTVFTPLIGRHNLLVADGEEHARARRMINPAFHYVSLKSMVPIIVKETGASIEELLIKASSKENQEKGIDLQFEFNIWTLSIIASSAFGSGFETIADAKEMFCQLFAEILDATTYRSMLMINQIPFLSKLPFWRRNVISEGTRKLSTFVDRIIADRRQGLSSSLSNGPDLLDLLLTARDDQGVPFNDQEVREESMTFVAAGSETTGNLMVWLMYVLMTQNDILQDCREEIDRILPKGKEPTYEDLQELVICEAVINEALRLYPPAALFVRYNTRDHDTIGPNPIHIPEGASVIANNYALHRRADLWPNPLKFDYTRWLRDPKTGLKPKLPHPFAYLPFAAGPRSCIGQNFALIEARIILSMLLQRCDFELIPGQKIVPEVKITMRTKYGLYARIFKRRV